VTAYTTRRHALNAGTAREFAVPTGSLYTSTSWNLAFAGRDAESYVISAHDPAGALVGTLLAHVFPQAPGNLVYNAHAIAKGLLGENAADPDRWSPQLLLGGRNGQRNGYYVTESEEARRREILGALIDESRDFSASAQGFLYLDEQSAREILETAPEYLPIPAEPDSSITLNGPTFEDFLAGLESRHRYDVRRDLRRVGAMPSVQPLTPDDSKVHVYGRLAAQTQRRHNLPGDPERLADYISRSAGAGVEAVAFTVGDEASPVAFSLAFIYGGTLWVRMVGLEYGPGGDTGGAYPAVLIYGPVHFALDRGLQSINVGAGVADFKRRRGATSEPRWSLIAPPPGITTSPARLSGFVRVAAAGVGFPHTPLADKLVNRNGNV
jgi:predicted N-acyltransferase